MEMQEITYLLDDVRFKDYIIFVGNNGMQMYLQAEYIDHDIATDVMSLQKTRKWMLSPHMTKSEIVQTAFKCCLTSMEHRTREAFKYKGRRIFGPHFDVDALHGICKDENLDYRRDAA